MYVCTTVYGDGLRCVCMCARLGNDADGRGGVWAQPRRCGTVSDRVPYIYSYFM